MLCLLGHLDVLSSPTASFPREATLLSWSLNVPQRSRAPCLTTADPKGITHGSKRHRAGTGARAGSAACGPSAAITSLGTAHELNGWIKSTKMVFCEKWKLHQIHIFVPAVVLLEERRSCSRVVCGYCCSTTSRLKSCDRDWMAPKAQNIHYGPLYRQRLPSVALQKQPIDGRS